MKPEKYEQLFTRLFTDLCKQHEGVNDAYNWLNDVGFTETDPAKRELAILKARAGLEETLRKTPAVSADEAKELAKFAMDFSYKGDLRGNEGIEWEVDLS